MCCGLAWGTHTHQCESPSLLAVTGSGATASQPALLGSLMHVSYLVTAPPTCQQKQFEWGFLGIFLQHYAVAENS